MLKVFRRIRRELIDGGNLKKYLLYAFGEILLVMVGILLALQVNNWNINRLENIEEQNALLNLKRDFELNEANLLQIIDQMQENIKCTASILNHTGQRHNSSVIIDIDSLLIIATITPKFFPRNSFLNEIINSGKLSIIESTELRNLLSSWQAEIDFNENWHNLSAAESIKVQDYVSKHGNWLKADSRFNLSSIDLPQSGFKTTNLSLLQKNEFENLVDILIIFKDQLLASYNKTLAACKEILDKLEQELKQ